MSDSNSPHDVVRAQASNSDPELLARLREVEAELAALKNANVVRPQFTGEPPRYKLNDPVYLEDYFLEAGREIEWDGDPNLSMVPLNEPAKRRMNDFIDYLSESQRSAMEAAGRTFTGLITDKGVMIAQGMQDARRGVGPQLQVPEDRGVVPPMPNTEEAMALARRRPGRPKKLGAITEPPAPPKGRPDAPGTGTGAVGPGVEPQIFRSTG